MKRWPLILLIVSLVANIFLAGVIAGSLWRWTHHRETDMRAGWRMRAAEALPEPQAEAFRQTMRNTVRGSLPVAQAARAARAEAARLFIQPNYDAAAITANLDRARAAEMILRTNVEHQVVTFSATLPLDQRRKLAEALRDGPFRQGRQHGPTDRQH